MGVLRQIKDSLSGRVSRKVGKAIKLPEESKIYTLEPQDLMKSKNVFIVSEIKGKKNLVWTADSKSKSAQLQRDVLGQVQINHKGIKELGFTDDQKTEIQKMSEASQSTFNEVAKKELGDHYDAIMKHYSQLSLLATVPLSVSFDPMELAIKQPRDSDISMDLYLEKGEVYFKAKAQNYPVSRQIESNIESVGHLPGYVEVLFKLDKDRGFVLQHISTNSGLMRTLFMEEKVNQDSVINAANAKWQAEIRKIEANLEKRKKQEKKPENKKSLDNAKVVIQEYKAGKIEIQDVHSKLSNILSQSRQKGFISRFFPPVSGTAKVLKNVLADLERTTGYKPALKVQGSTLRK